MTHEQHRLNRLEDEVNALSQEVGAPLTLRRGGLAAACLLGVSLLVGATSGSVIRAERFELIGPGGEVVGVWSAEDKVELRQSPSAKHAATLQIAGKGPELRLESSGYELSFDPSNTAGLGMRQGSNIEVKVEETDPPVRYVELICNDNLPAAHPDHYKQRMAPSGPKVVFRDAPLSSCRLSVKGVSYRSMLVTPGTVSRCTYQDDTLECR